MSSVLLETRGAVGVITLNRAVAVGQMIAAMPPKAIRAIKRTPAQGAELPLDATLALEHREFLLLFDTRDKDEGMRASLQKRCPSFTGH